MNEKAILHSLKAIRQDIADIKETLSTLPRKRLPLPPDFNMMGKRRCFCQRLRGGFIDPEIRAVIVKLRRDGSPFKDIAAHIKEHWPNSPEKHPSRSAIHRFCMAARNGRLREFGIEGIE